MMALYWWEEDETCVWCGRLLTPRNRHSDGRCKDCHKEQYEKEEVKP